MDDTELNIIKGWIGNDDAGSFNWTITIHECESSGCGVLYSMKPFDCYYIQIHKKNWIKREITKGVTIVCHKFSEQNFDSMVLVSMLLRCFSVSITVLICFFNCFNFELSLIDHFSRLSFHLRTLSKWSICTKPVKCVQKTLPKGKTMLIKLRFLLTLY